MAAANFPVALAFVWRPGFDTPGDGYHVTEGDAGGGTFGGVIEKSWQKAVEQGLVQGLLKAAKPADLAAVLHANFWGAACDALPGGLDFALFNGRMMSGGYPRLFQQALGFTGDGVDGEIGTATIAKARLADRFTLLGALHGAHHAYLSRLFGWAEFGGGWTKRLLAARETAVQLSYP